MKRGTNDLFLELSGIIMQGKKQVFVQQLVDELGRQFELKNVCRLCQFAKKLPDF
ncbi:MAG: hypothetical protein ACI8ZM_003305 [Crocinitomix sp.]|jgi:hypothetical protein